VLIGRFATSLETIGVKGESFDYLKKIKFFEPETLTNAFDRYVKVSDNLGTVGDALGIALSVAEYIEIPTTSNLLRVAFDGITLGFPMAGSLTVAAIELYKNENDKSLIDIAIDFLAIELENLMDCDLGAGLHGAFF
jgi:hypothetical protein